MFHGEALGLPLPLVADFDLSKKVSFDLVVNQYGQMVGFNWGFF